MNVIQMLAGRSYLIVNKPLIKIIGLLPAIVLSELASEHEYWKNQNKLNDGWFYSTIENITENINFTAHQQRVAINYLTKIKILEKKYVGIPAKRYLRLNEENLNLLLSDSSYLNSLSQEVKNFSPRSENSLVLEVNDFKTNSNKNNNIFKNNISSMTSSENSNSIFDSTLKNKIKEEKEIKKQVKNKSTLIEKGLLDDITTEKMSDIDNNEVIKRREAAVERAAKREASRQKSINDNVIKSRMKLARELFTNEETLSLLENYLKSLQFSHNYNMSEQSWQNILDDIAQYASQPEKLNKAIRDCTTAAYRKIYIDSKGNSADNVRHHITDIHSTRELTEEERAELDKNLARNTDGSYMTF